MVENAGPSVETLPAQLSLVRTPCVRYYETGSGQQYPPTEREMEHDIEAAIKDRPRGHKVHRIEFFYRLTACVAAIDGSASITLSSKNEPPIHRFFVNATVIPTEALPDYFADASSTSLSAFKSMATPPMDGTAWMFQPSLKKTDGLTFGITKYDPEDTSISFITV